MVELRILNGYHRGATLPLRDAALLIGASEDADVVLVDPGVVAKHASLSLLEVGWALTALDGEVRSADSNARQDLLQLTLGDFARVGKIWLTVTDSGSSWKEPPLEPTDVPLDSAQMHDGAAADVEQQPSAGDRLNSEALPADSETAQELTQNGSRKRRFFMIPVVLGTVLFAAAAYAITAKYPGVSTKTTSVRAASTLTAVDGQVTTTPTGSQPEKKMSQEALRAAFRKRLEQVDLLKRFNLNLEDNSWSMQAALDEEEAMRFQRMLKIFMATNQITFPVEAKIGSSESMLPFKIQQVISGANASIVTQDGKRLYVGDEYHGMRLAAIDGSQLSFTGKRIIEVKW